MDPTTGLPGKKLRQFNLDQSRDTVTRLRHQWERLCNEELERIKSKARVDMSAFARHDGYTVIRRKSSEPIVVVDRHGATRTIRAGATASVVEDRLNGWTHTKIDPTALADERHARDVRDGDARPSSRPAQLTEPPSRGRQSVAQLLEDDEPVTKRGRRGRRSLEERRANRKRRPRRRAAEQAMRTTAPVTEAVPLAAEPRPAEAGPTQAPAPIPDLDVDLEAVAAGPERDEPDPATLATAADPAQEPTARRRGRRSLEERRANRKRRRRLPPAPAPTAAAAVAMPPPRAATIEIAWQARFTVLAPVPVPVPGYVGHQLDSHAVAYARPDTPDRVAFVDTGRRIRVHAHDDPDAILAALRLAETRFEGRQIVIRGDPAFRQLSLAIAAKHGIRAVEAKRALPGAAAPFPRAAAPTDPGTAPALPAVQARARARERTPGLPRVAKRTRPGPATALSTPRLPASERRRTAAPFPRAAAPTDPGTAPALPAVQARARERIPGLPRVAKRTRPGPATALSTPRLPASERRRTAAPFPRAAAPAHTTPAIALPAMQARAGKRHPALPRVAVAPRLNPATALPHIIHRSLDQLRARIAQLQSQVARLLAAGRTGVAAPSATPAKTSSIPSGTTSPVRKSVLGIKEMWTGRRAARQKRREEALRQRDEAERRRAEAERARITHPKYAAYRQSLEDGGEDYGAQYIRQLAGYANAYPHFAYPVRSKTQRQTGSVLEREIRKSGIADSVRGVFTEAIRSRSGSAYPRAERAVDNACQKWQRHWNRNKAPLVDAMERVAWDTHLEEAAEAQRKSAAEAALLRQWANQAQYEENLRERQRLEREQLRRDSPAPQKPPGQGQGPER